MPRPTRTVRERPPQQKPQNGGFLDDSSDDEPIQQPAPAVMKETPNAVESRNSHTTNEGDQALMQLDRQVNKENEEEEDVAFRPVSYLETVGISKQDINKLAINGYTTVDAIAYATKRDLLKINGISENKVERILKEAMKICPHGFETATTYHQRRATLIQLSTGSAELDKLLQGGIETGSITEIFGEFRTGKTQLMHQLAVTCQLPIDMGGGEGRCIWIDTENTFRPERIVQISQRYNLNPKEALDNIAVAQAPNTDVQLSYLQEAAAMMAAQRYALVCIDSATAL